MKKIIEIVNTIVSNMKYSFKVSWKASKGMTITRMAIVILEAFLPILVALLGKKIVDILTESVSFNGEKQIKKIFFIVVFLIILNILSIILQKIRQSIESMHVDLINYNLDLV